MSLNVSLISEISVSKESTGVFIRENGAVRELTLDEVKVRYPDADIESVKIETTRVFGGNITHNLGEMARKAGIYEALWRPHRLIKGYDIDEDDYEAEWEFEDSVTIKAKDITDIIEKGLKDLNAKPEYFKQFNSPNGWGMYEHFIPFVEEYLKALKEYPEAIVKVSR